MSDDLKALIAEARDIASGRWQPHRDDLARLAGELADALEASERALAFERLRQVDEALEASEQAPAAVDRTHLAKTIHRIALEFDEDSPRPPTREDWADAIIASGILQDAAEVEARGLEKAAEYVDTAHSLNRQIREQMGLDSSYDRGYLMTELDLLAQKFRARAQQVREGNTEVPNEGNATNG